MNFREMNDSQLAELGTESDEELVTYLVAARRAGKLEAAVRAAQILAYSYERRISGFVYGQIGSKGPLVVEEIAERTLTDAIASAGNFAGGTIEEFRGWIFRIARYRVIDYHRKGRVEEVPLVIDWGEGSSEREFGEGNPLDAVDQASVFNQAYDELNDAHKRVIVLVRFRDLPHKEVASQVNRHFGDDLDDPMTEQNVNQINSRFEKKLKRLLDEAEDPARPETDD